MRTNIVLNEDLLREAATLSSSRSKTALVEEALRTFVEVRTAARRAENYRARVGALDRKLSTIKLRETPLSVLRADRTRA